MNAESGASALTERAVAVGVEKPGESRAAVRDHLEELVELARTARVEVVGRVLGRFRDGPTPATFVGSGKVEEIRAACGAHAARVVFFDDELTPAQLGNIEKALDPDGGIKVIDRTELILDIFALRARTRESKLQVEKAQLEYRAARLGGKGILLSRLGGGVGTRGPGETKLESDRRRIRDRLSHIRNLLGSLADRRDTERSLRAGYPVGAVVGYTNVGKSSLVAHLTKQELFVEDRLFATLDTATRRAWVGAREDGAPRYVLLSDTVGFIRKFPPKLAASFRSTLEETTRADFLLHCHDLSDPRWKQAKEIVLATLADLGADRIPRVDVFTKADLVENPPAYRLAVSVRTGFGIPRLREKIARVALPLATSPAAGSLPT